MEKIHKRSLRRSERAGAVSTMDLIKSCFRYVEWEYGDLVMRYHGYAGLLGRGGGLRDMRVCIKLAVFSLFCRYSVRLYVHAML